MLRSDEYSNAFSNLGNTTVPASCDVLMVAKFTCALYGMPKLRQVNDARLAKFQLKYAPKKTDQPLKKIKCADQSFQYAFMSEGIIPQNSPNELCGCTLEKCNTTNTIYIKSPGE